MKKPLLIVLIIAVCISVIPVTLMAKARFGNWNEWDKSLPPWDNKSWVWEGETCCSRIISFPPDEDTPVWVWRDRWKITTIIYPPIIEGEFSLSLIRLSFLGNKDQASVIFLLAPDKTIVDNSIKVIKGNLQNAEFAIVAFPPKRGKIVIRVYENKDGLFRFLEKWTESFNNQTLIFPGKVTEFTQLYKGLLDNQFGQQDIEEATRQWLHWIHIIPRLVILDADKKSFFISIAPASIDRRAPILFFY
jgi:hypothetical protein